MLTIIAALFVSAILLQVATLGGLANMDAKKPAVVKRAPVSDDEPKEPLTKLGRPIKIVQINE